MQPGWHCVSYLRCLRAVIRQGRRYSSAARSSRVPTDEVQASTLKKQLSRTRNIGIVAHIDAGKTTTTERMLFYSGYTRRIGDVDDGSTVTDFLPAERARGITIQSAAITFHWPPQSKETTSIQRLSSSSSMSLSTSDEPCTINLIDTPGHADFTFEVVRSLRILDGAICILDGVAGVEAQTEKVWHQANSYRIPRLIYVNKLDRDGAAFNRTVHEIASRLHTWPIVCQIPWWKDGRFIGVGDAVTLHGLKWGQGTDGRRFEAHKLEDLAQVEPTFAAEIRRARVALVEGLTEYDEVMVEEFLDQEEDYFALDSNSIKGSLRRCLLNTSQMVTPVFAGASFRNIGVQPALDAVIDLLPSPAETPDPEIRLRNEYSTLKTLLESKLPLFPPGENTSPKGKKSPLISSSRNSAIIGNLSACALAFKVVTDAKQGVLVYVRVYSGSISRNAILYNTNLSLSEKAPRLLRMYASDAIEIQSIDEGQIGVIVGLRHARTGDTLIVYTGANPKTGPPAPLNTLQLRPIDVPPPVFFTSVEPNSLSEEKNLSDTMALLLREDPSLSVSVDSETGQTHLAGMGELHLEIAKDRLINDFKVKASTGQIEISYREAITAPSSKITETLDKEIAGRRAEGSCTAFASPFEGSEALRDNKTNTTTLLALSDNNYIMVEHPTHTWFGDPTSPDYPQLPEALPLPAIVTAFRNGVSAALVRGPSHNYPLHSTVITIIFDPTKDLSPATTAATLSTAARLAVHSALRESVARSAATLMEPVMLVTITLDEASLGAVVHDLTSARGGQITSLDSDNSGSEADNTHKRLLFSPEQLKRVYAPPDPFGNTGGATGAAYSQQRQIRARVPLREMVGYLKHLRSLTGGRGTFVMSVDRFEKMTAQRQKTLLGEL